MMLQLSNIEDIVTDDCSYLTDYDYFVLPEVDLHTRVIKLKIV